MQEQIQLFGKKIKTWLFRYRIEILIVIFLFILTLTTRLLFTLAYPIEVGLDGAYYTINVYTILNGGFLFYDAPFVAFAVASIFSLITHDIIIGVKVASSFFEALLVIGVFFAAWSFTERDWRAGLIAGVLCGVDVSQFQLVTSLVKNQAALAFLPFALVFFYRLIYKEYRWSNFLGFIFFGCLTTLSHLMTAAILFATIIVFAGYEFLKKIWIRDWRSAFQKIVLPLILGGLIFLSVYVVLDFLIPAADTWYTSSSLMKASGYSTNLFWGESVASLFSFLFMGIYPTTSPVEWNLWLHIGIAVFIVIGIIVLLVRNTPGDRAALSLLFSTTLLGLGLASWAFRFNAMLFVPLYIILAMGMVPTVDKLAEVITKQAMRLQNIQQGKQLIALILIFIAIGGMLWIAIPRFVWTAVHIRPRASPQDLQSIEAMQGMFPDDVKLYAKHGIEYFITSRTWYEAAPESGSANFPVYAAQRMYFYLNNYSRSCFYIIEPGSRFLGSFQPIKNNLLEVLSFGYFDLFKDTIEIIIQTTSPVYTIRCIATSMSDSSITTNIMLNEISGNIWQGNLSLISLPNGMCRLRIVPFNNPPPAPPDTSNVIGDHELLLIYHFEDLNSSNIELRELLIHEGTAGYYQIFGVNATTAEAINLLKRDVEIPDFPGPPRPPEPYMLVITPLYYLPFYGELSNFVIILVFCPVLGLYWLFGGLLLLWISRRICLHFNEVFQKIINRSQTS